MHRLPRNITKANGDVEGNPHPDATGGNKAKGADILLTLQYTRTGLSGPTYKVWHSPSSWLQYPMSWHEYGPRLSA
jgi:hypothetical protein